MGLYYLITKTEKL